MGDFVKSFATTFEYQNIYTRHIKNSNGSEFALHAGFLMQIMNKSHHLQFYFTWQRLRLTME